MSFLKLFEKNKPLVVLNFAQNRLRDAFALGLIQVLNVNRRVQSIGLADNVIDLKHIRTIERLLRINQEQLKKGVIPHYRRQLNELKYNPADYSETLRMMEEVNREVKLEKVVVNWNTQIYDQTEKQELKKTSKHEVRFARHLDECRRREQEINDIQSHEQALSKAGEDDVRNIRKKVVDTKRLADRVQNQSRCLVYFLVLEIKESIQTMTAKYQAEIEQLKVRLKNESTKL